MLRLLFTCLISSISEPIDSISVPAVVSASKENDKLERLASPVSAITLRDIESTGIRNPKGLSSMIPSLHIPDYGATLTSTIYVRGFGSRMENPVMGLYIDDIPILDKNAYDFDYLDIRSATMLRGPQGTIYGRNSMCGLLSLRTLSPSDIKGLSCGIEYGSANTVRGRLSLYSTSNAIAIAVRHSDGFFDNGYTGAKCDPYNGGSFRWKWEKAVSERLSVSNIFNVSVSDEGAFSYGQFIDGELKPAFYNDEGSYRRLTVLEGLKGRLKWDKMTIDGIASIQLLADDMKMDQDYTAASIFTLNQKQWNKAGTAEVIFRPANRHERWNPVTGVFGFARHSDLKAPVTFKRDGIETLILANTGKNIPSDIGTLEILDNQIPINSDFSIWTWNVAVYHESAFSFGRWTLTAGLRLDCEGGVMGYSNYAPVNYQFLPYMTVPKPLNVTFDGGISHVWTKLLPKAAALYSVPIKGSLSFYGTVSKGFRAGGFNTQIFSDIIQSRMMNVLMEDLGIHFDKPKASVGAGNTEYGPEMAWNYEIGARHISGTGFNCEAGLYYMDGRNQQLTVFPAGKSIGRMMTNAGRSASYGADIEATWRKERLFLKASYGWNHAEFTDYDDGSSDFSGNIIPYSPEHTLFCAAEYSFAISGRKYSIGADTRGVGPIWWNEENTLRQPFYTMLGGHLSLELGKATLYLRGENLSGTKYNTFYFKSMGNEFFQRSKPAIISIGIKFKS